jgi:hypothetical protein
MTNWAKGGGGSDDLARAALGAFVSALGGASRAAAGSAGGVQTAGGFGDFLADVSRDGLETTLEAYGLADLVGGDPIEVMNELAGRIAGAGESPEEAVARDALLDVLQEVFEDADTFADMDAVVIDAETLRELLARYLTQYIFLRVLHELGERITDNASPGEAERLERQLGDQLRALVDLDLSTLDPVDFDWRGAVGRARLQELLADAYRMVSAGE